MKSFLYRIRSDKACILSELDFRCIQRNKSLQYLVMNTVNSSNEEPSAELTETPSFDQVLEQVHQIVELSDDLAFEDRARVFIANRLKTLEREQQPVVVSVGSNQYYCGFLHPESTIRHSFIVDPFQVNDPELYVEF